MMRRHVGRHRPPDRPRPVAPLATPLDDVEIEVESLFAVLRHLFDGRTADDSWDLGLIEASDMRTARRCVS